jgi:hypothetical protein
MSAKSNLPLQTPLTKPPIFLKSQRHRPQQDPVRRTFIAKVPGMAWGLLSLG